MRLFGRRDTGVVATYAAVLDGAHLWLDVDGAVSLRDADEAVVELGEHPYDLTGLRGASYDVLAGTAPVRLAEPPHGGDLARTPLAPDGVTRWEVDRLEDGRVRLSRRAVDVTAVLDTVDVRADRLHLRIRPADGVEPGSHLLLLDTDDLVRASVPATAHDGVLETLLGVDDLPAGYFGVLRLAVGTETSWVRIRRRDNDLADPNHAVLLPELFEDAGSETELGSDRPRARLRWNPDGLLALRSIDPDEAGQRDGGAQG